MSTKRQMIFVLVLVTLLLAMAQCGPTAAPAAGPTAEAPAAGTTAEAPAAAEPACDFDQATCDFLKGKDFTGQTLVVGVWGGVIEEILRDVVIPPLEARGAKVELLLGGTGDRMAKIYAEKGNPTMDIAYLNIYEAPQAVRDGVAEAGTDEVPAAKELYPLARKDTCYGMSFMGLGIAYNKDAFPTPPEWADLWKPEYKGKIAFPVYPGSEGDGFLSIAGRLAGKDEHDADAAFGKLAELKPVPMTFTSLDEVFMLMDKGDVVAAPMISGYAWTYKEKGLNVDFSWPTNPGPVQMMDTLCIVKDTKYRDLALAYTQLALSQKTQTEYANRIFFGPTNSKVTLSDDVAGKVVYGEDQVNQLVSLDWEYIIQQRPEWTERWNKELLEQ
jgi:putative spermidine/putrescine transport system substrate-binding protein